MMRKIFILFSLLFFTKALFAQKIQAGTEHFFYENKGQIFDQAGKQNEVVKYLFTSPGLNVQLRNSGFSYDVHEIKKTKSHKKSNGDLSENHFTREFHRVDIDFKNASKIPQIIAEDRSEDVDNYYNIPGKTDGVVGVHRYRKVTYKNLYPNIDLVFFKPNDVAKPIEYNFVVKPGGKISDIQLHFEGAKSKLKKGKIALKMRFGEMQENIPSSWIENKNGKTDLNIAFKDLGKNTYGFHSDQDTFDQTVIIDPVPIRIWGSYFNGTLVDKKSSFILADKDENVYFGGETRSVTNIATAGAFQTDTFNDEENGFVQKFDKNGKRLWGTLVGNYVFGTSIFDGLLNDEALYIAGSTFDKTGGANNITTPGVHKQFGSPNTREGFILKFDFEGKRIWGTYYGGTSFDAIFALNFDRDGNILAGGFTDSLDQITTSGAYLNALPTGPAGFFSKFNSAGQLLYGSYFYRQINHIIADQQNNVIIAGQYQNDSKYPNIATPGSHQPDMIGEYNAYLLKFDSAFNKLWGTYFGGLSDSYDSRVINNWIAGIGVDTNNNIIIAGTTRSFDHIATPGAFKETHAVDADNGYIAKFFPNGTIDWSTYYGNEDPSGNMINDMFLNEKDEIYVGGTTKSTANITTPDGYQPNANLTDDGYFAKFSITGSQIWGTYYSDRFQDFIQKITFANTHVYVIGYTTGTDVSNPLGTPNTFMPTATAGYYVGKFQDCPNLTNVSVVNEIVCPAATIELKATGGTSFSWTGPDGFTSSLQNPNIPNATLAKTGLYVCYISGAGNCSGRYSIRVTVEDLLAPVPDIANLPTITGDCKTIISTIPTATDSCVGLLSGTTTDPLQYSLPGNYVITWNYNDGNGNSFSQTQNVNIISGPAPLAASPQIFCKINNPTISDIQIAGPGIKWYDSNGVNIPTNTLLIDGTKYFATQNLNGCESVKKEILIKVNDPAAPTGTLGQKFCADQTPTIADITIVGQNIKWFNAAGIVIPTTTPLVNGAVYTATQTVDGCESTQRFSITIVIVPGGIVGNDYSTAVCNDNATNTKTEDLTIYTGNLILNSTQYTFEFYDSNQQLISDPTKATLNIGQNTFNVKIINSAGCTTFVKLNLLLQPQPILNIPTEVEFCSNLSIFLDAGSGFKTYEWTKAGDPAVISTDQILTVVEVGQYTVRVTSNADCENSATVNVVKAVQATITSILIAGNTATVIMSEAGDFEYSVDQVNWQNSNIFTDLVGGIYTVYVRTKAGCDVDSKIFTIFALTNVFTPNTDGINDTWKIPGLENYPGSEVKVFDRLGILVFQKTTSGTFEWDGKSNSRILPTGNYWYVVQISDGRLFTGWVLLKNRN